MDFPDQLIDAHGAGELVVFAGAGVSMPLPTGLPSFKALAVQVGNEAGLPLGRFDQLDAYLGRVTGTGYPVKERVAQVISAGGAPNVLHAAVLGLFKDAASVRIVTTNFDRKLWDVAAGRWSEPPREDVAPALPFGGDMEGIVYLHGAVHDSTARLVVTDRPRAERSRCLSPLSPRARAADHQDKSWACPLGPECTSPGDSDQLAPLREPGT
jgi:NAD-dependent SIR2 family protein deacetylase